MSEAAGREAELRARLAEAERVAELRARVVGHVAHEFRTPLSSILGFAALLADDGELTPEQRREFVGVIHRSASHLLHVVNDILNLTKVEDGTLEVTLAPVEVGQVAAAVVQSLRPMAAARDIVLELGDTRAPAALADAGRLRQVLLNLMDNAIKYSGGGRTVEVCVLPGPAEVTVEVRDEGPGIAEGEQELIFHEFSRIHHPGARVAGAGLGLALAKELTEAMGGRIGVRSRVGVGSTFWVTLPATSAAVDTGGASVARPEPEARREGWVAVIDDDEDIRALATVVLERAGYSVHADDGTAGVAERVARVRPRAVLLDLNLGERTGTQVLAELRQRDELRSIPVLAFTAAVADADRRLALDAGFDGHVPKPVEPDHLLARVNDAIAAGRRTAPAPTPEETREEEFWAPLRARFRAGLPARAAELEAALAYGDVAAARRLLHKVRGTAAGYGFIALSECAARAEDALRAGATLADTPAAAEVVRRLRDEGAGG